MDRSAVRHGIGWGWRGISFVFGGGILLAAFELGTSTASYVAMTVGVVLCVGALWSDAGVALRLDAQGLWPVDARRPPMAWSAMHEIVQRSWGVEVRDDAGRTLHISSMLQGERELVERAFHHAVENQRRTVALPFVARSETRSPTAVSAGVSAVMVMAACALAVARDSMNLVLAFAGVGVLSALLAAWLWRRRFSEVHIDAEGITFVMGPRRSHVTHGSFVALVAIQQGGYALHGWDAELRQMLGVEPSMGLARVCAHLMAAGSYELPPLPPLELHASTRREARWALVQAGLRWWLVPALAGGALAVLLAPDGVFESAAAHAWTAMVPLSIASTLATVRRYRRRVRGLAVVLGLVAGAVGFVADVLVPPEPGTWSHAAFTAGVDASLLLLASLWLARGTAAPDELASDLLQLGATFGGVALLRYAPGANPYWSAVLLVLPLVCGAIVAAPWVTWVHAKTPRERRWRVPLVALIVVALTVLQRVDFEEVRARVFVASCLLSVCGFVVGERLRRAQLVPRAPGAPMRELALALTLGMIAAVVYTASRPDAWPMLPVLFAVSLAPAASAAALLVIGALGGTHEVSTPLADGAAERDVSAS